MIHIRQLTNGLYVAYDPRYVALAAANVCSAAYYTLSNHPMRNVPVLAANRVKLRELQITKASLEYSILLEKQYD